MSTTAINNAKKLKKISETQETKTGFLVFMLIVFIVILIGTSVYGFISRSGTFKGFYPWGEDVEFVFVPKEMLGGSNA